MGSISYPDVHENFHWDPTSPQVQGTIYSCQISPTSMRPCYVLTQSQLRKAVQNEAASWLSRTSGNTISLCSAATDPYTQCGFTKLIPISHLDDFHGPPSAKQLRGQGRCG